MIKIKCPKCGAESSMSLTQTVFEGPYRCWKCKETFLIKIANDTLESCEPISQEDFEQRRQQIEAERGKG